jgi:Ca2+-binding RTX toxin-like protein
MRATSEGGSDVKRSWIAMGLISLVALTVVGVAAAHQVTRIKGTHGDDQLTGTPSADLVVARAGNDTVSALDGNDRIFAGLGNDSVDGGAGNDRLRSGGGTDMLTGGDGDDVLFMVADDNKLDHADCGAGNDIVWVNANESDAHANCETVKTVTVSTP